MRSVALLLLVACEAPAASPAFAADSAAPAAPVPSSAPAPVLLPTPAASDPAAAPPPRPARAWPASSTTLAPPPPAAPTPVLLQAAPPDPTPPRGGGHYCFTWRTGHASSSQCYASIASCAAERRALGQVEQLGRCEPRTSAFCTRVSPGGTEPEGPRCFGDAARCMQFRSEVAAATSPCAQN